MARIFEGTYDRNGEISRILIADVKTGETRTLIEEVSSLTEPSRLQLESWTPSGDLLIERIKFNCDNGSVSARKPCSFP